MATGSHITATPIQDSSAARRPGPLAPHQAAAVAALLCVLGLAAIWSSVLQLWELWTTDALKSIGMVIPVVSFLLVLRAWRSLSWRLYGTWWGFALMLAVALLVRVREQAILLLVIGPQWTLSVPPVSLVIFLYGVGAVLLFGGTRLVRASIFPLVLLLFVNPIPHVFNVYVDLPLQRASAHVARAFAIALGQPLSPDKLRLMFTPEFGMFIAPGCNGIRGAVTMGLIALIAGYLYRFRWQAHGLVVLGAVALGYLFNFVRLCVLVLFYLVALHFPTLQDHAENADYVIGAALFFVAVFLLYTLIQRLAGAASVDAIQLPVVESEASRAPGSFPARAAALAGLVVFGLVGVAHGLRDRSLPAALAAEAKVMGRFPQTVGGYNLVRTWNEDLLTGTLLFHWAEYAPAAGGNHIALGVSPVLGAHDTMVCHSARGEDPLWHDAAAFPTLGGQSISFNASFFNDGATQYFEATTLCNQRSCGEYASPQKHFGLVYSKPTAGGMLNGSAQRTIPILLKAETIDTTLPADAARAQLLGEMGSFLGALDLNALTQPYRKE